MERFIDMIELIKKEKHPTLYAIKIAFYSFFFPQFIKSKIKLPSIVNYKTKGCIKAFYLSAFSPHNAGDTLLPVILRDLIGNALGINNWEYQHVHELVTTNDILKYNSKNLVIIGGGGLFLKDTNPNQNSGWQWNCSIQNLNNISKPLIAFAIGYNRFRGQQEFDPIFFNHINAFVKKASFIGLRNNGSIKAIKQYITDPALKEKIVFQPCMTTLLSRIYPNFVNYNKKKNIIVFNCAFDRQESRAINDTLLYSIARVAKKLSKFSEIRYYSHMESDKLALKYFDELQFPYKLIELKNVRQIIYSYAEPSLVIGMRGHSQLIPFGCNTPILSIISHEKMKWFLEDINHVELGIDVLDPDFETKLEEKAIDVYQNKDIYITSLKKEQDKLNLITQKNLNEIKALVGKL